MARRGGWAGRFAVSVAVLVTLGVVLTAVLLTADPSRVEQPDARPGGAAPVEPSGRPDLRLLSSPDFMNTDVADLSRLPGWRPGMPNSWSDTWAESLDLVVDTFAAERPDDVLVAGDLVNGHWGHSNRWGRDGQPAWDYGVLGPVATEAQRRASVRRAAGAYYGQWLERFQQRGIEPHVAVGDHELGDNSWRVFNDNFAAFKHRNLELFRSQFADRVLRPGRYEDRPPGPANRTAYATQLSPDVLLVTVDVFLRRPRDVVPQLDRQQLRWLDRVLADAERRAVPWVVVQGHVPVAGPVRTAGSSGLMYRDGTDSAFWRTMAEHGVDLYLCGEVHDITAIQADGVTQVSHGGLVAVDGEGGSGNTNYLVGDVHGDRMWLTDRRFEVARSSEEDLWQPSPWAFPPVDQVLLPDPPVVGSMVLTDDGEILHRDGLLAPYDPAAGGR